MRYELGPGTVPRSALLESLSRGFSRCEPCETVPSPLCVYSVSPEGRSLVGIVSSVEHVSALVSSSSELPYGGVRQIARWLGTTKETVHSWIKRYPGEFPEPAGWVNDDRVWLKSDILEWNDRFRPYGRHLPTPVEATNAP